MLCRNGDMILDPNFLAQDANYPFVTPVTIFGINPDVDSSNVETVSPQGIIMENNTPKDVVQVVSDSLTDVGVPFVIVGLDDHFDEQTEIVTLNGTTPVTTVKEFLRVNLSFPQGTIVGNVTCTIGGTYVSGVDPFYNRSQDCHYTVPRDHGLFIKEFIFSSLNADKVTFYVCLQIDGEIKRRLSPVHVFESAFQISADTFYVDEKSVISVEAIGASGNNNVTAIMGGDLVSKQLGKFSYAGK